MNQSRVIPFPKLLTRLPTAVAVMQGSPLYPKIQGTAKFYQTPYGVLVATELIGLPDADNACEGNFFGLHIHNGERCAGNFEDPFAETGTHYNPNGCPHPDHAGDLPPILGANGIGYAVALTDRFTVGEIVGRTVVLHEGNDDFSTRPAGNAGRKIACGEIRPVRR